MAISAMATKEQATTLPFVFELLVSFGENGQFLPI